MNSRREIQKNALKKMQDAQKLYDLGCYDNAFYLAGYAVELALKARICKNIDIDNLFKPDSKYLKEFKTHNFDTLLMFSGLSEKLNEAKSANVDLYQNWSYLCTWKEDVRYISVNTKTAIDVERFLNALNHPSNGFLKWIKKYW